MKSITVFCASSTGNDPMFKQVAYEVGKTLALNGIDLVYGGAKVGLMGAVANGALENGGRVIGVLPGFLRTKEVAHEDLNELIIVGSMHERKLKMHELCDGVIALPGGFGTMEELFEMLTWSQLGLHAKPIGLLNVGRFYDPLVEMMESMYRKELLKEEHFKMMLVEDTINNLLIRMKSYKAMVAKKWMSNSNT